MSYLTLKTVHIICAVLSISGFVLRGCWMLAESPLLRHRVTKIVPHIVDTALLVSAIALAWMAGFAPWRDVWLGAKVIGLLVYIVLGTIALRRGKTKRVRAIAFVLAVAMFAYIAVAALTKHAWPFTAL